MKNYIPRCIKDLEDKKCHAYISIYKKSLDVNEEIIDKTKIRVRKGFDAVFIKEIKCRILEWGWSEYRVRFINPDNNEDMDFRYHQDVTHKQIRDYFYVLRFEVEDDFISQCL